MSNEKYIPSEKQIVAFKNVIKAMRAAKKAGLCFYGKQDSLVAYTKEADDYTNQFDFCKIMNGRGKIVHHLSSRILSDSGADDYAYYLTDKDDPDQ